MCIFSEVLEINGGIDSMHITIVTRPSNDD
jgi:hypothetical protein